jgi:hypothetical protein
MTAEPRPHIAGLKSFCQTQVDMTVGDKRLTFGTGPAVAPAIRLLLLYLGLPHSGRSRKDSDIKIDMPLSMSTTWTYQKHSTGRRWD